MGPIHRAHIAASLLQRIERLVDRVGIERAPAWTESPMWSSTLRRGHLASSGSFAKVILRPMISTSLPSSSR